MIHDTPRNPAAALTVLHEQAQPVFPEPVLTKDRMTFDIPYEE